MLSEDVFQIPVRVELYAMKLKSITLPWLNTSVTLLLKLRKIEVDRCLYHVVPPICPAQLTSLLKCYPISKKYVIWAPRIADISGYFIINHFKGGYYQPFPLKKNLQGQASQMDTDNQWVLLDRFHMYFLNRAVQLKFSVAAVRKFAVPPSSLALLLLLPWCYPGVTRSSLAAHLLFACALQH